MATRKWSEKQIRIVASHVGIPCDQLIAEMNNKYPIKSKKDSIVDPNFQPIKDAWLEAYPYFIKKFNAAYAVAINDIIRDTKTVMEARGKEITYDGVLNSFKYVIAYVKRQKHFCDGKPLTTWNQQYLSIVHEIANGKAKPLSTREKINQM